MSFRGLQVLASSLRSVDARRPFVLLTDSASAADANVQATAHTWRLQVVQVALLAGTGMLCSQTANTRLAASFTTFAAWNLTQYDKVLWLEMDQLVLRPLDTLWATHLGDASVAAAPTAGSTSCSNVLFGFNSGVQLLRPSAIMLAEFLAALYSGKYECGSGFQALWNSVLTRGRIKCLPSSFNCACVTRPPHDTRGCQLGPATHCLEGTASIPHILHFSGAVKPWHASRNSSRQIPEWALRAWRTASARAEAELKAAAHSTTDLHIPPHCEAAAATLLPAQRWSFKTLLRANGTTLDAHKLSLYVASAYARELEPFLREQQSTAAAF